MLRLRARWAQIFFEDLLFKTWHFRITLFSSVERGRNSMLTSALISVIVTLIVVGLLLYLIGLIPMDGTIKQIIRVVVIIAVIIWVLQTFGLLGSLGFHHALR
jgi:hypothetical protein